MKNIYCFKNRLVGSFLEPTFDFMPKDDKKRYAYNFCILKPEEALKQGLNELDLYFFGTYDDEHGTFYLVEPELLIQLDKPFEELRKARAAIEAQEGDQNERKEN